MTKTFERQLTNYIIEERHGSKKYKGSGKNLRIPSKKTWDKKHVPIQISRQLISDLQEIRKLYIKLTGLFDPKCQYDEPEAIVFLLGQKDNVITNIELIESKSGYGCGSMCRITSEQMAIAMYELIKKKRFVAGLVKISSWDAIADDGIETLLKATNQQGMVFIQLALDEWDISMPNISLDGYEAYSYKIV